MSQRAERGCLFCQYFGAQQQSEFTGFKDLQDKFIAPQPSLRTDRSEVMSPGKNIITVGFNRWVIEILKTKWTSVPYYTTPKGLLGMLEIWATDIRPLRGLPFISHRVAKYL